MVQRKNQPQDPVFIEPLSDIGFKHTFASDGSQPLLKEFITLFLGNEVGPISKVEFVPNELFDIPSLDQKIVLDVFCKEPDKDYYIVEMQRIRNRFPIDRSIAYASRVLSNSLKIKNQRYVVPKVHSICLMEQPNRQALKRNKWMWSAKLRDEENRIISENPTFHFLELGIFARQKIEPRSLQELWMYLFCNMSKYRNIPDVAANSEILTQLFDRCRFSNLTEMEKKEYRKSIFDYADVQDAIEGAKHDFYEEGKAAGIAEEKLALAKSLLEQGVDLSIITRATGLTAEQIGG